MSKFFLSLALLCFCISVQAQKSNEKLMLQLQKDIEIIQAQEKENLKLLVDEINDQLEKKEITTEVAEQKKKALAEASSAKIITRITPLERELEALKNQIKEQAQSPNAEAIGQSVESKKIKDLDDLPEENEAEASEEDMDNDNEARGKKKFKRWYRNDFYKNRRRGESVTTTQFVFAFGLNNVITKGGSIDDNGIKVSNSRFYEWGITWKSRLSANSPRYNIKYGLSLTYNNLRPDNNTYFIKEGDITYLGTHPQNLIDEPYFRTINLVIPVHFEFDFSKKRMIDDEVIVRSQKGFRFGIGGYAGVNTCTKQILEYKDNGLKHEETTRGDYNNRDFIYGLSAYIGYKDISLYSKLDMNTLFKDNAIEQRNISLGIRFDFN